MKFFLLTFYLIVFICASSCTSKANNQISSKQEEKIAEDSLLTKILTPDEYYRKIIFTLYECVKQQENEDNPNYASLVTYLYVCCSDYIPLSQYTNSPQILNSSIKVLDAAINSDLTASRPVRIKIDEDKLRERAEFICDSTYNKIIDDTVIGIAIAKRNGKSYKEHIDEFNTFFADCIGRELKYSDSIETMNKAFNKAREKKKEEVLSNLRNWLNKCLQNIYEIL